MAALIGLATCAALGQQLISAGWLVAAADSADRVRVIVMLKDLGTGAEWEPKIASSRQRVMDALKGHYVSVNRTYAGFPAMALTVDQGALRTLRSHPEVASVAEDGQSSPQGGAGTTR